MSVYEYRGLSVSGKATKGIVDAPDTEAARKKLKLKGIYLETIREMHGPARKRSGLSISFTSKRKETTLITRQLAFLLSAGVPVVNALEGVIGQLDDGTTKSMMINIRDKVKEGKSVSKAFSEYPDYFNQMYVSTLHAGEVSGQLEGVFDRLSGMYEKNQQFISRIRSSLTYPSLMLLFGIIIIVFLISFIVPTFSQLFSDFGQVLPLPTRILIGISNFVSSAWWIVLIVLCVLFLISRRMYMQGRWKHQFDSLVLKLPGVKKLLLDTFHIRFSYTMGLMLANGVGIIDALTQTEESFKNTIFRKTISNTIEMVKKGETLSRALASGKLFSSSILGMIHAGEVGDRVPDVLERIGSNMESQLEEKLRVLTSLIEPIVIVILGIFIGFAVLAIILPIFQINQFFG
ncbi:MAG: type II secretion system F family protein [Spirochaetota bacterium]|nr:MAG: type II secretion system F family protein [Spirochaetota bacterium]